MKEKGHYAAAILMMLAIVAIFGGCQSMGGLFSGGEKAKTEEVINAFLTELHDGEVAAAIEKCDALAVQDVDEEYGMEEMEEQLGWYAYLPGVKDHLPEMLDLVYEYAFKEWKIEETSVKGDQA